MHVRYVFILFYISPSLRKIVSFLHHLKTFCFWINIICLLTSIKYRNSVPEEHRRSMEHHVCRMGQCYVNTRKGKQARNLRNWRQNDSDKLSQSQYLEIVSRWAHYKKLGPIFQRFRLGHVTRLGPSILCSPI